MRQDAVNKAKAFDEKHQLRANASARINSFDKRVGLSQKINNGISVVNEKVKSVDQRLHVSDKTMAALLAAERKLNDTGSAVTTNRSVSHTCFYAQIIRCIWIRMYSFIIITHTLYAHGFLKFFIADFFYCSVQLAGMCLLERAG